jgi:hypothetical protein
MGNYDFEISRKTRTPASYVCPICERGYVATWPYEMPKTKHGICPSCEKTWADPLNWLRPRRTNGARSILALSAVRNKLFWEAHNGRFGR